MRSKQLVLLSLAAFALLPAAALGAARLPSGAEISVNVSHLGVHVDPSVAVFPDGGFVVVWSNGPGYERLAIHARLFASNGSPTSGEFRLVDPGAGSEHADQVVADRDGTFLVAWSETRSPGGVSDIFVRRFRRDGTPAGARSRVNPRRPASRYRARLAVGANGRFAVAWTANVDAPDPDLSFANAMARFFAADGTPLGDEILVAKGAPSGGDSISFLPEAVTLAPDGTLAVVFQDTDIEGIFTYLSLYKANREISSNIISRYDCCVDGSGGAALTRAADGSLVAAWGGYTIFAQRFSPQGVPQDQEFVLPKQDFPFRESVPPSIPRLAALPEGGFLAAWTAAVDEDHNARVFARVFTADGTPLTRDFQLSSDFVEPMAFYDSVTVAANQKGPAVVVWQEKGGANLRARLFTVR
jgi:hypothetical protein